MRAARRLKIYAKNIGWSELPFPAYSEEQVVGDIDSRTSDVLQRHRSKNHRANVNKLPDPESMVEIRRAHEERHWLLEVNYGTRRCDTLLTVSFAHSGSSSRWVALHFKLSKLMCFLC